MVAEVEKPLKGFVRSAFLYLFAGRGIRSNIININISCMRDSPDSDYINPVGRAEIFIDERERVQTG
jgi:hypothetical protein